MAAFDRPLMDRLVSICQHIHENRVADIVGSDGNGAFGGLDGVRGRAYESADDSHTSLVAVVDLVHDGAPHVVVAFRGTLSVDQKGASVRMRVDDWVKNFEAVPVDYVRPTSPVVAGGAMGPTVARGKVHQGFQDEWASVRTQVVAELAARPANVPVVVVGHSQGGAIAPIAAADLADAGRPPRVVYTFEAPRPGTAGFRDSFDLVRTPVYRMEYGRDIVPHVPLRSPLDALLPWWTRTLGRFTFTSAGRALAALTEKAHRDVGFVGVGELRYAAEPEDAWAVVDEEALRGSRRLGLVRDAKRLFSDHGLEHYAKVR